MSLKYEPSSEQGSDRQTMCGRRQTKVESGTSQRKSGTSVNLSSSGFLSFSGLRSTDNVRQKAAGLRADRKMAAAGGSTARAV